MACAQAPRAIIDRLIEGGMNFEEKDKNGDRAIETAIRCRNRPALDALLRRFTPYLIEKDLTILEEHD